MLMVKGRKFNLLTYNCMIQFFDPPAEELEKEAREHTKETVKEAVEEGAKEGKEEGEREAKDDIHNEE